MREEIFAGQLIRTTAAVSAHINSPLILSDSETLQCSNKRDAPADFVCSASRLASSHSGD